MRPRLHHRIRCFFTGHQMVPLYGLWALRHRRCTHCQTVSAPVE